MDASAYDKLTPRERELLRAAATGQTAKEIGRELDLSYRTVQQGLYEARAKLGLGRSVAAGQALLAFEASNATPEQIQVLPPELERLAPERFFPATPMSDELPELQPSAVTTTVLREPSAMFEGAMSMMVEPISGSAERATRGTDGLHRNLLLILAWTLGIPLVLAIAVVLYLGVTTIEKIALGAT